MISRWNLNCEHAFPSLPSSAVFIYIFNCISLRRYDGDDRVPPPCRVRRRCAACTWQAHALPRAIRDSSALPAQHVTAAWVPRAGRRCHSRAHRREPLVCMGTLHRLPRSVIYTLPPHGHNTHNLKPTLLHLACSERSSVSSLLLLLLLPPAPPEPTARSVVERGEERDRSLDPVRRVSLHILVERARARLL